MKSPLKRKLLYIGGLVLLLSFVAVGALLLQLRQPANPAFLTPPSPNGYELLLDAAKHLGDIDPSDITNEFGVFVAEHHQMFADAEAALAQPAEAPARWYDAQNMPIQELPQLRKLANTFELKSRHAQAQNRGEDASEALLNQLRFGQSVGRGLTIHLMVGTAIEISAIKSLDDLAGSLDAENLKNTAARLLQLNTNRVPLEAVLERERYFMHQSSTFWQRLQLQLRGYLRRSRNNLEERYLDTAAQTSILAASMAARAHLKLTGTPPSAWEDLVPDYLPTQPMDPYGDAPLLLRASDTNLLVYSRGPNRKDNGGAEDDITLNHQDKAGDRLMSDALSNAL